MERKLHRLVDNRRKLIAIQYISHATFSFVAAETKLIFKFTATSEASSSASAENADHSKYKKSETNELSRVL